MLNEGKRAVGKLGLRVRICICVSKPCLATTSSCLRGRCSLQWRHDTSHRSLQASPHSYSMTASHLVIKLTYKERVQGSREDFSIRGRYFFIVSFINKWVLFFSLGLL